MEEQPDFVVEDERVALGPLRLDLVPDYQRWSNDLEVANGNGWVIPFTLEAQRDRIASRGGRPDCADFTVYDRSDGTPVGFSSLFHIDHRTGTAEFGIFLGERRGKGLGTEATRLTLDWGFTVLGLHNIMLSVAAWNERAIRVYVKAGFRELGRRRGADVTMGRRGDGIFMELLALEFRRHGRSVLAGRAPWAEAPAAGEPGTGTGTGTGTRTGTGTGTGTRTGTRDGDRDEDGDPGRGRGRGRGQGQGQGRTAVPAPARSRSARG